MIFGLFVIPAKAGTQLYIRMITDRCDAKGSWIPAFAGMTI